MNGNRSTQPYRRGGPRPAGMVLFNMLRGRDQQGFNPIDVSRETQRRARGSTLNSLLRR